MKKFLLITSWILSGFIVQAQDGKWKIKMNGKTLIYTGTEDEKINTKKIKFPEWRKSGYLEINYLESDPSFWKHSILFVDETDNQLFSKENTTKVKIPLSKFRKLFAGKKELRIYIIASPANPDMAIRSRRIHLCTLKLP